MGTGQCSLFVVVIRNADANQFPYINGNTSLYLNANCGTNPIADICYNPNRNGAVIVCERA